MSAMANAVPIVAMARDSPAACSGRCVSVRGSPAACSSRAATSFRRNAAAGGRVVNRARARRRSPIPPVAVIENPAGVTVTESTGKDDRKSSLRVDFLVIGSGISGLSYALEAAEFGKVAVVTKDVAYEGSTHYAQGGISAVIDPNDTAEEHARDTQIAGDFLCDQAAVDVVCAEGKDAVDKLVAFGCEFTRRACGSLHLAREGGHSKHRIVHAADMTGKEIERALLESARAHPNVTFYEHHAARDLVVSETLDRRRCVGAEVIRRSDGAVVTFLACCTLLACGGAGQLFPSTTNPSVSTGDGVAMAVRARADVANMEFYQFHPTSLYTGPGSVAAKKKPNENAFLVTEAVRGHGGRLFNHAGERFMSRYDDRLELAPRDVVARAIDCEIKSAAEAGIEARCVYLDVSHLPADDILEHFPVIAAELKERGLDMTSDRIPVVPAAHYLCGGVRTDLDGQTFLDGLFACGETACTGLHGANRLASNSLLEAVVFANRAFRASVDRLANDAASLEPLFAAAEEAAAVEEIRRMAVSGGTKGSALEYDARPEWAGVMRLEGQRVMWSAAGIVRDSDTLARAEEELEGLLARCDEETRTRGECLYSQELRNLITVGLTVVKCAGMRKESRGLHYNVDYPERVESERQPTVLAGIDKDCKGETGASGGPAAGEDEKGEVKKVSFTPR